MKLTKGIMDVIRECATKHTEDVNMAVDCARRKLAKMPDYADFVEDLVLHAIRELVYDVRHRTNEDIKRAAGVYGQRHKVSGADSKTVQDIARAVFEIRLDGTVLGNILGSRLPAVAQSQREQGYGHLAVAELCEKLVPLVPSEKTVREALSPTKAYRIWKECQKQYQPKVSTNGRKAAAKKKVNAVA